LSGRNSKRRGFSRRLARPAPHRAARPASPNNRYTQCSIAGATGEFLKSLTPAEQREFNAFAQGNAFKQVGAMNAALARVKNPSSDEISTPEERAAFGKVIVDFLTSEMQPD
jgi:hypothetical protein